ncbi:L-lactate dehydrogenase, FMN-linked [Haemophilus aegyptius]|nr:L-lactate dehydrogenase, FMN-linked [Haemophilus aegyptius]
MFHYADGGSYAEQTLARNVSDLENIALRQRVLKDMSELDTSIELFGEKLSMPTILAPVGGVRNVCTSWRSTSSTSGR